MKNFFDFLFLSSDDITQLASADVRRRKIINFILAALAFTLIIFELILISTYIFSAEFHAEDLLRLSIGCMMGLSGVAVILLLNRHVSSSIVGAGLILIFYIPLSFVETLHNLVYGRSLILLTLPIVVAAILFPPWGGFLAAVINSLGIAYIAIVYEPGIPSFPAMWIFFFMAMLVWQANSILERALKRVQQVNAELEKRVVERTAELQSSLDQLQAEVVERRRMESALQVSEERLQSYNIGNFVGVYLTGMDHPIDTTLPVETQIDLIYENAYMAECNEALAKMYNLPSAEAMIGTRMIEAHGGKDDLVNRATFRKWIEGGYKSYNDETTEYAADGKPIWFLSNTIGILENNYLTRMWGTAIPITERKQMEEALRASEELFSTVFKSSPIAIAITRLADSIILNINEAWIKLSGYTKEEAIGHAVPDLKGWVEPKERERMLGILKANGYVHEFEFKLQKKSDELAIGLVSIENIVIGGMQCLLVMVQDITERKQAEEDLRASNERYQSLFEDSPISIWEEDFSLVKAEFDRLRQAGVTDFKTYWREHPEDVQKLAGWVSIVNVNQATMTILGVESKEQVMSGLPDYFTEEAVGVFENELTTLAEGGTKFVSEISALNPKKGQVILELTLTVQPGYEGTLKRILVSCLDITERRQAEDALRESENKFRTIFDVSADMVMLIDSENGRVLEANNSVHTMLGYDRSEILSKTLFDLVAKTGVAQERIREVDRDGRATFESRWKHKDGHEIPVEIHSRFLHYMGRNANLGIIRDITERKRAEEALQESQQMFLVAFDSSPVMMAVARLADDKLIMVNQSFLEVIGAARDETLGQTSQILGFLADPQERANALAVIKKTGSLKNFEMRLQKTNGQVINVLASSEIITIGKEKCLLTNALDITERKRSEDALHASEARYRAVVEDQTELICRTLPDGTITFVNDAYCKYFGQERQKILGHSFMPHVLDEDRDLVLKVISALNPKNEVVTYEHRVILSDGSIRWQQWTDRMFFDETGQAREMQSVGRDITERKHMEEMIRENRERFRTIFRSSAVGIAISRVVDGKFTEVNNAFCTIFGYRQHEVINRTATELGIWYDPEERNRLFQQLRLDGFVHDFEARFRKKSGEIGYQHISMEPIELNGQEYILGSVSDITEKKRAEEALRNMNQELETRVAERTAELNQLARKVVTVQEEERKTISDELHDEAGQLLIALRSPLDLLYDQLPASMEESRQLLKKVMRMTDEAAERIRDMSHKLHPPALEALGLQLAIQSLCRDFYENTATPVLYQCGETELGNVSNEISISIYRFVREALANIRKHANASKVEVSLVYDNETISISVWDNGRGMPADLTSDGIGLKSIEERVHILGGQLQIKSPNGNGTLLFVSLPRRQHDDHTPTIGAIE